MKANLTSTAVFLFFLGFYSKTLAPDILWGDPAKHALYVYHNYLSTDLIGGHPLHILLGRLFTLLPFGTFAWRLNFSSAFLSALTLLIFFQWVYQTTRSLWAALVASLALGFSHIYWFSAVVNDSYALVHFLWVLWLWLLFRWDKSRQTRWLYASFFVLGLSFCNNLIAIFAIPALWYLLVSSGIFHRFHFRSIVLSLVAFLIGVSFLILLMVRSRAGFSSDEFMAAVKMFFKPRHFMIETMLYPLYLFYQFPLVGLVLGYLGAIQNFKQSKKFFLFLAFSFLGVMLFASAYLLQRKFFLLGTTFTIFAYWIGVGWSYCSLALGPRKIALKGCLVAAIVLSPLILYYSAPSVVSRLNIDLVRARTVPLRDNALFYLLPDKSQSDEASRYAETVMNHLPLNALLLADFTIEAALRYYQEIKGYRKDVELHRIDQYLFRENSKQEYLDFVERRILEKPIYLADDESYYCLNELKMRYKVTREGLTLKVSKNGN